MLKGAIRKGEKLFYLRFLIVLISQQQSGFSLWKNPTYKML
jgi:hypothetical protein